MRSGCAAVFVAFTIALWAAVLLRCGLDTFCWDAAWMKIIGLECAPEGPSTR